MSKLIEEKYGDKTADDVASLSTTLVFRIDGETAWVDALVQTNWKDGSEPYVLTGRIDGIQAAVLALAVDDVQATLYRQEQG